MEDVPVFVFGSNQAGRHGKGAALHALQHYGAVYGMGEGLQGRSYGIPTKDAQLRPLALDAIQAGVLRFLAFAASRQDLVFQVTPIGCGLAGYRPEQIAPMFAGSPSNCILPPEFSLGANSEQHVLYAGIGSRQTPDSVLDYMSRMAGRLAELGFVLRSGGANGADMAFEDGCDASNGKKEVWLPWRGFNGHADTVFQPKAHHFEKAATLHPAWERLGPGPRKLHARNVGQILGMELNRPVSFVVCWTPDGCETEAERGLETGGTGTAISLAARCGIPVFNLRRACAKQRLGVHVNNLLK